MKIKEKNKGRNRGFTLIELIVVMSIIGILVLLAVAGFSGKLEEAKVTQIKNDTRVVERAVEEFLISNQIPENWILYSTLPVDVASEKVFNETGKISETPIGEYYEISDDFLTENAPSRLNGTFVTDDEGDTYYIHDKTIGNDKEEDVIPAGWIPIYTSEDFVKIGNDAAYPLDGKFIQMADIDMAGVSYVPTGTYEAPFNGQYNGNSHILTNQEWTLFGYTGTESKIFGITSRNVNVTGDSYVGAIASVNTGVISDVTVNGHIEGRIYYNIYSESDEYSDFLGGVVGYDRGSISNATFKGDIDGTDDTDPSISAGYVGGIVGGNVGDGQYEDVAFEGEMTGATVGGILGMATNFQNETNTTSIDGANVDATLEGNAVGGIVGQYRNEGQISNASFKGKIDGYQGVAGIVGTLTGDAVDILDSTVNATITGESDRVGGAIGAALGNDDSGMQIKNIEVIGSVTGNELVGGLIGTIYNNLATITDVSMDGVVSGSYGVGGLFGRNDAQVLRMSFTGSVTGNDVAGGIVGVNQGTIDDASVSGDVTLTDGGGGNTVGGAVGSSYGDIRNVSVAATVTGTTPTDYNFGVGGIVGINYGDSYDDTKGVLNASFEGSIVGVKNAGGIAGKSYAPIEGSQAIATVTASSDGAGGITGLNYDSITASFFSGDVSGANNVGGVTGDSYGPIKNSEAKGSVTASNNGAGGIAGLNHDSITTSSFSGDISGIDSVGGITGESYGPIQNSYASGSLIATGSDETKKGAIVGFNTNELLNSYVSFNTALKPTGAQYGTITSAYLFTPGTDYASKKASLVSEGWDFDAIWTITDGKLVLR